jgi:hypothetical protein
MEETIEIEGILKDIDITISLRSGVTDLKNLQKLMKVLTTSSTSLKELKIVNTESEINVKSTANGKLTVLKSTLRIE